MDRVDVRVTGRPILRTRTGDIARGVPRREAEVLEKLKRVEILAPVAPADDLIEFTPSPKLEEVLADTAPPAVPPVRGVPPVETPPPMLTTDAAPVLRKRRGRKPKT